MNQQLLAVVFCQAHDYVPSFRASSVNLGRQLGSSPSNNFATRLVRLTSPLNILASYSFSIDPLHSFTYFKKIQPFCTRQSRESRQSLALNSNPLPCPPQHGLWPCAGLYQVPSPRCSDSSPPNIFAKFTPMRAGFYAETCQSSGCSGRRSWQENSQRQRAAAKKAGQNA